MDWNDTQSSTIPDRIDGLLFLPKDGIPRGVGLTESGETLKSIRELSSTMAPFPRSTAWR